MTRQEGDVRKTLAKYRVSEIFDQIIQMDRSVAKSEFIRDSGGILIDDSFSEREAVSGSVGIPTSDCSMIEMVLDDLV